MQFPGSDFSAILQRNKEDFASIYDTLRWITSAEADHAADERAELLKQAHHRISWTHNETKPYYLNLSPGCRMCGSGAWSCLFVNGICNAKCFYCPTEQTSPDIPTTSSIQFKHPRDYVDYLRVFDFKGVSISGGEPFLTFDRTMQFISAIKRHFGDKIYLWLYTNGMLTSNDKLLQLGDAGVDEIRFNIGATGYRLDHVRKAVNVINHVTVEIPAVPERYDLLKQKVREMEDIGVDFFNLHQIRCTPYNYKKLLDRNYTFLHGPAISILESELTALKLLNYVIAENIKLPVNYCSLVYRNRFQTAGVRRRAALCIKRSYEDITAAGLIRSLSVRGNLKTIDRCAAHLRSRHDTDEMWHLDSSRERLYFNEEVSPLIDMDGLSLVVSYHVTTLRSFLTYRNLYREIYLNEKKKVVIERGPACREIVLTGGDINRFCRQILCNDFTNNDSGGTFAVSGITENSKRREVTPAEWETIIRSECLQSGLAEYS